MDILPVLKTIIEPLENWAEQELESIGSAFLSAMGVVFNTFTNDQRAIGTRCTAFWQAKYDAARSAGKDVVDAAEEASTATLNEFLNEEIAEGQKVVMLITTALEISVANNVK